MKLTDEQAEIRDAVANLGTGNNLKVIAFAGAGKTTTLKSCAEARNDKGIYLAFNKSIANEANTKFRDSKCSAMTMHSLAWRAMKNRMGHGNWMADINTKTFLNSGIMERFHIPEIRGWGKYRIGAAVMRTMSTYAAGADRKITPKHAEAALVEILGDPDFVPKNKAIIINDTIDKLIKPLTKMTKKYWKQCLDEDQYNHDMYLKMLDLDDNLRQDAFSGYKYIMIDEAQDINPVQRSILNKTGVPLIAVGDPYQQIYSWRGAENALQHLPGQELFLTQSFRFGENIAGLARNILKSIPDGGGPKQRLVGAGTGTAPKWNKQKAIICRTNMGVLFEAIKYQRHGAVHVDNMAGLLNDVLSAEALWDDRKSDVKSRELKQFDNWEEMEIMAEEGSNPNISKLVKLVKSDMIPEVKNLARNQTPDPENAQYVVCTGHRSKGLEFPVVRLGKDWPDLDSMKKRYKKAKSQSEKHLTLAREAYNTLYVATTRAMYECQDYERILDTDSSYSTNRKINEKDVEEIFGLD